MPCYEYAPDPYEDDEQPSVVECKRCGKSGLHWEDDDGKWVLIGHNGAVHKCDEQRVAKAMASEFEPIK